MFAFKGFLPLTIMFAAMAAFPPAPARAAGIIDDADMFSADAREKAHAVIQTIREKYRQEVIVETVKTVPDDKVDEVAKMDKDGKAKFFANWAVKREEARNSHGVFIFICKTPGHVQVTATKSIEGHGFPADARKRLEKILIDEFREKKFDDGLVKGVEFIEETLHQNVRGGMPAAGGGGNVAAPRDVERPDAPIERGPRVDAPANVPQPGGGINGNAPQPQAGGGGGGWVIWLLILGVVFVIIWLLSALGRSRQGGGMGGGGMGGGVGSGLGGMGGGYGGGYGGGGGFFSNMLGGVGGALFGNWLYDRFSGRGEDYGTHTHGGMGGGFGGGIGGGGSSGFDSNSDSSDRQESYDTGGGDFDSSNSGSGDSGGDSGGGFFGGGDSSDSGGGSFDSGDSGGGGFDSGGSSDSGGGSSSSDSGGGDF